MKKLYYILFFGAIFMFSGKIKAQSTTDGVVIAYPNPTQNSLYLKTENESIKIESVTFFSILGRPVATYKIKSNSTRINVESLGRGKYLMKYTLSNGDSKVKQIVKQ